MLATGLQAALCKAFLGLCLGFFVWCFVLGFFGGVGASLGMQFGSICAGY